jgi:hypothetical protein
VGHVLTTNVRADHNNVIGRGDIKAGIEAHSGVGNTCGVVQERKVAQGRVAASRGTAE